MLDTNFYFLSKDDEFLSKEDTAGVPYDSYQLLSRQYNTTYITIPFTMKLKTQGNRVFHLLRSIRT